MLVTVDTDVRGKSVSAMATVWEGNPMKPKSMIGICLAPLMLTAACGSSDSSSNSTPESIVEESGDSPAVEFDDDDVMFAQMMIPHHEQAIEMSDIALDPAVGASDMVRALAERIKGAQDPEIDQMKSLLSAWGQSMTMDSDMDHSTMMTGMLTLDELATLSQLRGSEFDAAWLEAMIAHHEGAIQMAEDALEKGSNSDVRALCEAIIAGQQAEIEEMRDLL
jgi:uncharacterized protein (DUF305 family)